MEILIPKNDSIKNMIFDSKNIVDNNGNFYNELESLKLANFNISSEIKDKNKIKLSVNRDIQKYKFYFYDNAMDIKEGTENHYDFFALSDGRTGTVIDAYKCDTILFTDHILEVGSYYDYDNDSLSFLKSDSLTSSFMAIDTNYLLKVDSITI